MRNTCYNETKSIVARKTYWARIEVILGSPWKVQTKWSQN